MLYSLQGVKEKDMTIVSKLFINDFFSWGVWQKINLTGNREISFEEIEKFANEVKNEIEKKDYECEIHLEKVMNERVLKFYKNYITKTDNKIRLNDGITFEESKNIFLMNAVPSAYIEVFTDKKIGEKVFLNKTQFTDSEQTL